MSQSYKGKDFLFSDDCGFINGDDGDSYRYSDGSGYYSGSDGGSNSYYDDGDDNESYSSSRSDSDITLAEGLVGLAMGIGAVSFAKHSQKAREERKAEQERQRESERIATEKRAEEERIRRIKQAERKHERNIKKETNEGSAFQWKENTY
ncbi:MAG: hypothetical protein GX675_00220 [Erysipelotrichaceae bacterium]|nr:hypothetical protein [Erysipelotrichaceae bacterium]